jgi:hypothetical protein
MRLQQTNYQIILQALATFPVGHYVNFRTMRKSNEEGYAFAFIGDEQASPHFMRYSKFPPTIEGRKATPQTHINSHKSRP